MECNLRVMQPHRELDARQTRECDHGRRNGVAQEARGGTGALDQREVAIQSILQQEQDLRSGSSDGGASY